MNKKTIIILAGVALIAGTGAWYWGSPLWAMSQLRDAAIEGDEDDLRDRINFASVREALKADLGARMVTEMAKEPENPFGAMGSMMAMGFVGGMVDAMVTPEGMAAMIKEGKMRRASAPVAAAGEPATTEPPADWNIERDGFSRFRATPLTADNQEPPTLVFERDGLGWNLVELDLPPEPSTAGQGT
jgi:hypothetical protein